jgi:adenine/guanine/hypoxanthine permease
VLLTFIPARQKIIDSIPEGLKTSMAVSVGVFVFTIGLYLADIIQFDKETNTINGIGNFFTAKAYALYIGVTISAILGIRKLKFTAGMLVAIIISTIYCKTQHIEVTNPATFSTDMFKAIGKADIFSIFTDIRLFPVFITFFLIDFYGSIGKFIGLTKATNIQSNGELENIEKAMYVDGFGTIGGALLGTSSIITFVESAVGITMGGRTGIVAVVCGLLMLASLFITPLVGLVPVQATAGILCYVGYLLSTR